MVKRKNRRESVLVVGVLYRSQRSVSSQTSWSDIGDNERDGTSCQKSKFGEKRRNATASLEKENKKRRKKKTFD